MREHLYTIALVCLMVLAVWWLSLMPAQAQIVNGGNSRAGGITGNPQVNQGGALNGVANVIHAGTGTLAAALGACPQISWQSAHTYAVSNVIADSNGDTEYVEAETGNSGGSPPSWPTSSAANIGTQTTDGSVTWEMIALGKYAPSAACTVIADPGQTYTVPSALIIGSITIPVTLRNDGALINCTDTGGTGHACLVEADKGHIKGPSGRGASAGGADVSQSSTSSIDSLVESEAGYLSRLPTKPIKYNQINFDLDDNGIIPNPSATGTVIAAVWESAIDGDGWMKHVYIGPGKVGTIGLLVDDAPNGSGYTGMHWNNLNFVDVWVGVGAETYGVRVQCTQEDSTSATSQGANLSWTGGAIVDGSSTTTALLSIASKFGGNCLALQMSPYLESTTGETGDFVDLSGASDVNLNAIYFNGGPALTNCLSIANVAADRVHLDGRAGAVCTNVINNAVANQTLTYAPGASKGIWYNWSNPSFSSLPIQQVGGLVNPFGPGGQGLYYSAAGTALPACAAAYERYFECVSDSTACTSGTTYTSGGSTACLLQCNNAGNAWKETGVGCF